jgi:DNA-directed RNA polymerase specialized sigma24 family protein
MSRKAEILEGLGGMAPALRRYARALAAGAAAGLADEMVQSALQGVGARIRDREFRPADLAEARIEAYTALTALAGKRLARASRPTALNQPPIVQGLAELAFDERAALLLVSLEGFGYDAAARVLGASHETLLARLMRARAALAVEGLLPAEPGARRAATHLRVVK